MYVYKHLPRSISKKTIIGNY